MNLTSSLILRFSISLLFLWFGIQQLIDPGMWIGFLPEWTGYFPIPGEIIVGVNGWFEIVFAGLITMGLWTRFASALLGLHLLGIAFAAGGAIGIRDAGLAAACLSLAFQTPDRWTLDHWFAERNNVVTTKS